MKCIICGKEISKSKYMNADLCSQECFNTHFWDEALDDEALIDNKGNVFHIHHDPVFRGFGGRTFYIKKLDTNKIIKVDGDLWSNGNVIEDKDHVRKSWSSNIEFVSKDEYDKYMLVNTN